MSDWRFRRMVVASGVAVLVGATAAHADEAYDACMKTAMTNFDFDQCGGAYVKRAEAALNAAWKQTIAEMSGDAAETFKEEQRAWIAYRDKSCLFDLVSGSGRESQVIAFPTCRAEIIADRTREIVAVGQSLASH